METGEIRYEIFNGGYEVGLEKTARINALLGYPKGKTLRYRNIFPDDLGVVWAGGVDKILVDACANMTPEERILYYDDSDLKTYQFMEDAGFDPCS
jgi:hypothetical protein